MFITDSGMVCPVGTSAAAACAAKRAGIAGISELTYLDNNGKPVMGGTVPGVDPKLKGEARLVQLLVSALTDLVESASQPMDWERVPLLVSLAEPRRLNRHVRAPQMFIGKVESALGIRFSHTHSKVFPAGHTGGFDALAEARRLLSRGAAGACVVCGVDSLLDAVSLLKLDRDFRLKTPANRDGVIPGEAAAAVIVQLRRPSQGGAAVVGIGFADEPAPLLSEQPLRGLGLTEAARAALSEASLGLHEIDLRLSDVTGELYGFKELPLVEARLMRVVRKIEQPLWHWAEAIGDSGAAAGVAELVLADNAFRKRYAPGKTAICYVSSIDGARAVAVVRRDGDS
jgi:3-oxoacyl-[acyl-carrier-protein] synthase-1